MALKFTPNSLFYANSRMASLGGVSAVASDISFSATGDLSATDVQAALEELDTEKAAIADLASVAFSGAPADLVSTAATSFTPVLTAATPGDLSVAYSTQLGRYGIVGPIAFVRISIITSSFTHSTASGNLNITGLPISSTTAPVNRGTLQWSGITKANYTDACLGLGSSSSTLLVNMSGSGQATATVAITDLPSGGSVTLTGSIFFWHS